MTRAADLAASSPVSLNSNASSTTLPFKRHAEMNGESIGAPRAKRRFDERMSAALSLFHIDDDSSVGASTPEVLVDGDLSHVLDSPSSSSEDDEMGEGVEDADDSLDEAPFKRIKLDAKLQEYLKMAREVSLLPPKKEKGLELVVWQPNEIPMPLRDPFEDPAMNGRIREVHEGEATVEDEEGDEVPQVEEPDEDEPFNDAPDSTDSSPLIVEQLSNSDDAMDTVEDMEMD